MRIKESTDKTVVLNFSRMNPPTIGHLKLVDTMAELQGDKKLYLSHTQDKEKNPLSYEQKLYWCKKAFEEKVEVVESEANTIIMALVEVYNEGYNHLVYVGGSDRIGGADDMSAVITKYNGVPNKKGVVNYSFDKIDFVSAGIRDENSDDLIEKASASLARLYVRENNFEEFCEIEPFNEEDCAELFDLLKAAMDLDELLTEDKIPISNPDLVSDECKEFLDYVYNCDFIDKKNAKAKLINKFELANEVRSIYGNKYYSVRFSLMTTKTNPSALKDSKAGSVTSIRNVINFLDKPLFNVVINPATRKATVWLVSLGDIKFISGPYYNKNLLKSDSSLIIGTINGSDLRGEKVTSSNFDELWSYKQSQDTTDEVERIFSSTIDRATGLASKHVRPTLDVNKLAQSIHAAEEYISSSNYSLDKRLLDNNANLCNDHIEELAESGTEARYLCEYIIKNGNTDVLDNHQLLEKDLELADIVIGKAFIDIKTHLIGTANNGGELIDAEKLIDSINKDTMRVYMLYKYDLETGHTTYVNIFDDRILGKLNVQSLHGGAGRIGQIYGNAVEPSMHIDFDRAYDKFTKLLS